MSQQALSDAAEVSTRHLSCLETGKAQPSRQMVLVLGSALDIPLDERNALLASAGFTPAYGARSFDAPEMAPVRAAVAFLLERFEPFPAIAVDRTWRLQGSNRGANRLLAAFVEPHPELLPIAGNAMHLMFHPRGLRPWIVDWERIAAITLSRLRHEALREPALMTLYDELLAYPGCAELPQEALVELGVLVPVELRRGEVALRFATLITTLGTPVDATAQGLSLELYYPLDEATEAWFEG